MVQAALRSSGVAFIDGLVRFSGIPQSLTIPFLADTGAENTCLMPTALSTLPLSLQAQLAQQLTAGVPFQGIGGIMPTYRTRAVVGFQHADGTLTEFALQLALIVDRRLQDVPSILGRDVLFRGQLSAGRDGVVWDVEAGEHAWG